MNGQGSLGGLAVLGVCVLCATTARAAFEAPAPDPVGLALPGAGPAWPADGGGPPTLSGPLLFGRLPRAGVSVGALQWVAAPEVTRHGAAVWCGAGSFVLRAGLDRLSVMGYDESSAMVTVTRPAQGTGWGGAVGIGIARWGSPGFGRRAMPLRLAAGVAPLPTLRLAVSMLSAVGSGARELRDFVEAGVSFDAAPGWRVGAVGEARPGGARLRMALECRAASACALRGGFTPGEGSVAFGVGLTRGALALDLAQSRHPRLGAMTAAAVSVAWGGR